jgi:drug/metabolite transporter (DMT)-like permease
VTPTAPQMISTRDQTLGVVAVIVSAVLFAFNGIVAKVVLTAGGITPTQLVSLRTTLAAAVLLALLAWRSPAELRLPWTTMRQLATLGIVGIATMQWSYFNHLARLPVSVGMLIQYTAPLLVALAARFIFREDVRPRIWVALALSIIGLGLVAQVRPGLSLDPVGLIWAGVAALSLALYYLISERAVAVTSPLAAQTWMIFFAALVWQFISPVWSFDWTVLGNDVPLTSILAGRSVRMWVLICYLIIAGTVITYLLVMYAIKRIGAPLAGLLGMLEPVLITGLGWLLLAESLTPAQILGATVTITGTLIAATSRRGTPDPVGD